MDSFSSRVKSIIASIPEGRVATYGQIAMLAGNRRAARQVAWILHSSSSKHGLPWQRVINRLGKISLPRGGSYEEQMALLIKEGYNLTVRNALILKNSAGTRAHKATKVYNYLPDNAQYHVLVFSQF